MQFGRFDNVQFCLDFIQIFKQSVTQVNGVSSDNLLLTAESSIAEIEQNTLVVVLFINLVFDVLSRALSVIL